MSSSNHTTTTESTSKNHNNQSSAGAAAGGGGETGASSSDNNNIVRNREPRSVNSNKQFPSPLDHKFWDSQPVPRLGDSVSDSGAIDVFKLPKDVQQHPYVIPASYEWVELDVNDNAQIAKLYALLENNYVEDEDNMFRFAYPTDFLRWALKPPGWRRDWHVAVRVKETKELVGFISAIPATIQVKDSPVKMVEINFLCVHKHLRSKRLAPVLIKEITRRVNLTNVWQAVYTAGILLPKPVAKCQYFHRSLNPAKLIPTGFSSVPPQFRKFKDPMQMVQRLYKLPDKPESPTLRAFRKEDVPQASQLVANYLQKFDMHPIFTEEEFAHWFTPRDGVINSFVVENPETKKITDFCSFYTLPSTIIGNDKFKTLKAAYSFYNVATSMSLTKLMQDALVMAKTLDFDVFNALDLMDNKSIFKELKFGVGDGYLHYYFYNWKCPEIPSSGVGLVML